MPCTVIFSIEVRKLEDFMRTVQRHCVELVLREGSKLEETSADKYQNESMFGYNTRRKRFSGFSIVCRNVGLKNSDFPRDLRTLCMIHRQFRS